MLAFPPSSPFILQGRLFSVKVGTDPTRRGSSGQYAFKEVSVTSSIAVDLQVCENQHMGEACSARTSMPGAVRCYASSANSIDVEWESGTLQESVLLAGYRVTAFDREDQVVAVVNSTSETRVTFTRGAANANQQLKYSVRYSVQVEALYDNASITSKAAMCIVPQDGLPCIPPPVFTSTANIGGDVGATARLNSKGGAWNCPCMKSHQAFNRLIPDTVSGILQPFGTPQPLYPINRDGGTYGSDVCARHDQNLPPSCDGDAPSWCTSAWCWVDPANCALTNTQSSYFVASKIAYSYATCGEKDTYSSVCGCRYVHVEDEWC